MIYFITLFRALDDVYVDGGGKKSHKGMFLYMLSPIRAYLSKEGEIQHLGGPSASGAAIEGQTMGSKIGSSEMRSDSVALQKSESVSN